jgi:hypothetical protein
MPHAPGAEQFIRLGFWVPTQQVRQVGKAEGEPRD